METLKELWARIGSAFQDSAAQAVPPVIAALLLLVVGWLLAKVCQALLSRVLRGLGLDRLADRTGATQVLEDLGTRRTLSSLLGRLVYWLVLLVFVVAAVRRLGMQGVDEALMALAGYLPSILGAALILFLGVVLARFVGDALGAFALQAGIRGGRVLGVVTRYAILGLAIILAMDQLHLEVGMLVMVALIVVSAIALSLGLAFGLGSRELAHSIMAGLHARDAFEPGEELLVRKHRGRLVRIDTVTTVLETDQGLVSLPNVVMVEEEVVMLARPPEASAAPETAAAPKVAAAPETAAAPEAAAPEAPAATEAHATEAPTTEAPTTEAPAATEAPATTEALATEEAPAATEAPATEAAPPAPDAPVAEEPLPHEQPPGPEVG